METDQYPETIKNSLRFYENKVAPLIEKRFSEYASRIAVGLAGEGSDCFGYDDLISRDHDFGTGVCLWVMEEDMEEFGYLLSIVYNEMAAKNGAGGLSQRLRERRGVMTVHDFYSNILGIDCDVRNCSISDADWRALDHSCLATAVNGRVFRDDAGVFTAFRNKLLAYYPDRIWRIRIAGELHRFSASVQVNYARCMTRGDIVAARICHAEGLRAAMELFFLMKRVYSPYYKWTFRRLEEMDEDGTFAGLVRNFSALTCAEAAWKGVRYDADQLNTADPVVTGAEKLAQQIVSMLRGHGFISEDDPYLEKYVNSILQEEQGR